MTIEELRAQVEFLRNNVNLETRAASKACQQICDFTVQQEDKDPLVNRNIDSIYRREERKQRWDAYKLVSYKAMKFYILWNFRRGHFFKNCSICGEVPNLRRRVWGWSQEG